MWTDESQSPSSEGSQGRDGQNTKQLERLEVSSGQVLLIDQFMLGNQQLFDALPPRSTDNDASQWLSESGSAIKTVITRYGGMIISVAKGTWGVLRDPQESLFVIGQLTEEITNLDRAKDVAMDARGNADPIGRVLIDTRCVVFIDAAILANTEFLTEYRKMRQSNQDKAARDVLRENGAAVRYGFRRDGDELGLFRVADGEKEIIALWPDVVDKQPD